MANLLVTAYGDTHPGVVRDLNEDNYYYVRPNQNVPQAQIQQHATTMMTAHWTKIDTTVQLRETYLPVVSKYEAKGWREGRTTKVLIYEKTAAGR